MVLAVTVGHAVTLVGPAARRHAVEQGAPQAGGIARGRIIEIGEFSARGLQGSDLLIGQCGIIDGNVVNQADKSVDQEGTRLDVGRILANVEVGGAVNDVGAAHLAGADADAVQVERCQVGGFVEHGGHHAPLAARQFLLTVDGEQEPVGIGRAETEAQIALRGQFKRKAHLIVQIAAHVGKRRCCLGHIDLHHGIGLGSKHHIHCQRLLTEAADGYPGLHIVGIAVKTQRLAIQALDIAGGKLRGDSVLVMGHRFLYLLAAG